MGGGCAALPSWRALANRNEQRSDWRKTAQGREWHENGDLHFQNSLTMKAVSTRLANRFFDDTFGSIQSFSKTCQRFVNSDSSRLAMRLGEGLGNTAAKGVIMGQTKAVIMSQKQNVSVQVRSQQDFRQVRSQYKSGHSSGHSTSQVTVKSGSMKRSQTQTSHSINLSHKPLATGGLEPS